MLYIGNIITKSKLDISTFFNVSNSINDVDVSIPTLIVGWDIVKEIFPEQSILDNRITDTISWTFSKREKRYKYEQDLELFIDSVIKQVNEKVNYKFFNFILSNEERRNDFISYVNNGGCSIYYNSRFLYVYNPNASTTIGVSLNDLFYIGINTKDFILSLNKNNNNIVCEGLKCIDNESFLLIKDNVKVIAYLNYLKNSDIYIEKGSNG
jgi:hypothetical protein